MSPSRKAWSAVAFGAALVVAAWWSLRPAAVVPAATAATPSPVPQGLGIDAAREAAAVALARAPADPWAFAEAVAASSTAAPRKRCGADEAPGYVETDGAGGASAPLQERPAGPHFLQAERVVEASLRASADPFDRVVADWLDVGDAQAPRERLDTLVQAATTTSDPRVYALAYRSCGGQREAGGSCALLNPRQWASLDAGNGVPWVYAFGDAVAADDASGQQEALAHLAAATRFDNRDFAPAGAVITAAPADDDALAATTALAARATGMTAAEMLPLSSLSGACRHRAGGDANLAQQCAAIGDAMYGHADSLFLRTMGAGLFFQATGDATRREVVHAEMAMYNAHWSPGTGFSECRDMRDLLRKLQRNAALGEVEAARERMRTFVTP